MKILCTFPGQFGDILWSLPTVSAIAHNPMINMNSLLQVDFAIMPGFRSLLPLLNAQPYIGKAFVIEDWIETGRPHGCQPWEAPVPEGYDKVYHLGYRHHPSANQPLIDFIAQQQNIKLEKTIPFLSLKGIVVDTKEKEELIMELESIRAIPTITYAFNDSMKDEKLKFIDEWHRRLNKSIPFKDVSKRNWLEAAYLINESIAFIGCRSANYVLACGLGKRVFVYEPNISRSIRGSWGTTFSCPYANETEVDYNNIPQIVDEVQSAINQSIPR